MKKIRVGALFLGIALCAAASARAADVGTFYWVFKQAIYTQRSTATPAPAGAPFGITSRVDRATGGAFLTSSNVTPPASGVITAPQFYTIKPDGSLLFEAFLGSAANLDSGFGSGNYNLDLRGQMNDYSATLSLLGSSSFPPERPKVLNTNFKNNQLVLNPKVANTLTWNSFASRDSNDVIVLNITNGSATVLRSVLAPNRTSQAFAANFLKPEQNYVVELSFVKVAGINTSDIPGSTGLAGFASMTRIYISTSSRTPIDGLSNISTRAVVGTDANVLISGFIVRSTDATGLRVILRALGPSLAKAGIANPLADPIIQLFDSQNHLLASNDNWKSTTAAGQIQAIGLAPADTRESALIRTLAPGSYTAVVRGKNGLTGNGLVEVYNLGSDGEAELSNISTRGQVLTGDGVMIAGLIVRGPVNHTFLLRALGPSLTPLGVSGALANPTLQLVDAQGQNLSFNDNWKDTNQAGIEATGRAPKDDKESALVRIIPAGAYTAIVRGKNDSTGVALVEVYQQN